MFTFLGVIAAGLWTIIGLLRVYSGEEPPVLLYTFVGAFILLVAPIMSRFALARPQSGIGGLRWTLPDWIGMALFFAVSWGVYDRTDPIRIMRTLIRRLRRN